MNKYEIKYTKDGVWTSHSFDTWKELKSILWELNGIKVVTRCDDMPKVMRMAIIEHNEKIKP